MYTYTLYTCDVKDIDHERINMFMILMYAICTSSLYYLNQYMGWGRGGGAELISRVL